MTLGLVIPNKRRADAQAIAALAQAGASTVHEAQGRVGLMLSGIRPVWPGAAIAGSAVTVLLVPGDNWMLHVAVEQCQPGDMSSPRSRRLATTVISVNCWPLRWRRAACSVWVIDAGCRDVKALREMNFPVWSKAVSAQGTVKETLGSVNVPVVCASQAVHPGDVIVADDDGVVVVPFADVEKVALASTQRLTGKARPARCSRPARSGSTTTACGKSSRRRDFATSMRKMNKYGAALRHVAAPCRRPEAS